MSRRQPGTLDERAIALTSAITLAAWVVFLGVLARFGWGEYWRDLIADLYLGYDDSALGLAIGATWAFADGFTVGFAYAWLYNQLAEKSDEAVERFEELPA